MGLTDTLRAALGLSRDDGPRYVNRGQRTRVTGSILFQGPDRETRAERRARTGGDTPARRPNQIADRHLEGVYLQEPLLRRAVLKRAGDLLRDWFEIRGPDGDELEADAEFQAWARMQQVKRKTQEAIISAQVYGDGYLELVFDDDRDGDQPALESASVAEIHVIDPTSVELIGQDSPDGGRDVLLRQRNPTGEDVVLHPDRYVHLRLATVPGFVHGVSKVEAAFHAAFSKVMADQALGEVLRYSGVPTRHAVIHGGEQEDIEAFANLLESDEIDRAIVTNEDIPEIDQLNPETVDPGPYYEAFTESISTAIGVPKTMLRGAQAGTVSGSETNLRQYHEDLSTVREVHLNPVLEEIIAGVTGLEPAGFQVAWQPFEVDEETAAEIQKSRAQALQTLVASGVRVGAAADIVGIDLPDEALLEVADPDTGLLPAGAGI